MGNCTSIREEDQERDRRNRQIDKTLNEEKALARNEVKLLLLGAGESGKSTLVKQMKIIHEKGYSEEERTGFKDTIAGNIVYAMQSIIDIIKNNKILDVNFDSTTITNQMEEIEEAGDQIDYGLFLELAPVLKELWESEPVKMAYDNSAKFQLSDNAHYYFSDIDRLTQQDYIPSTQDVLRSRIKTTGIVETKFQYKEMNFRMFDVGGQRSERKKWIHCFENVTAIIFCVALSAYDQRLVEDESMNRMHESLKLFDSIANNRWFENTSIILFLNKTDLFEKKITKVPLQVCFPEYPGPNVFEPACKFIQQVFQNLSKNPDKAIYPQLTCATDTENIKFVFDAVSDIIISQNLKDCGLL